MGEFERQALARPPNKPMKLTAPLWPQLIGNPLDGPERHRLTGYGMQTILTYGVATVVEGDFEWEDEKAKSNFDKHGVSFAEAATVFADPAAVYLDDGSGADRMVVIGTSLRDRVLYVVHVERGRRDRIISARPATNAERDVYESGEHS